MKTITLKAAKKRIKNAQETYRFMCKNLNDPPKTDIVGNALRRVMGQLTLTEAEELQKWFYKQHINPYNL